MGFGKPDRIEVFKSAEDDKDYNAWKVEIDHTVYVLKKTGDQEISVYETFLKQAEYGAPRFYKSINCHDEKYMLIEYIEGNDLRVCERKSLTAVLDALIYLQKLYWERRDLQNIGFGFEASLSDRRTRGEYLNDPDLEQAYETFLRLYSSIPRTLCHDDLLPFNVVIAKGKATIIDWEYAGILPYPTSLARLIAHGEEDEKAFFHMKQADKDYAIEYFFEHLLKDKGINYDDYLRTMDYFLLFEYCEWIMLGNKYNDTKSERFKAYLIKAKNLAKRIERNKDY